MNRSSSTVTFQTEVTFKSLYSPFEKTLNFFIIPFILDLTPNETIPKEKLNIPSNLKLADPDFFKPSKIDLLIGSGPTLSLFCNGQIQVLDRQDLILQKTKLGWVIGGGITPQKKRKFQCFLTNLSFDIEKFWNIEEVSSSNSNWSNEEKLCENHFKKHIQRNEEGRYIVALPFKDGDISFGDTRKLAYSRLMALQKKFDNNPDFKIEYCNVMQEYMLLKHMSLDTSGNESEGFYLPHHAVMKESSTTTKLRVVFDASAKSTNGRSLNDQLLVGPIIQDDLFSIILRFRTKKYVITADIEKMYRQFLIREEDRKYQKILWFTGNKIVTGIINTILFGEAPAPYLAIRCLHQLADDEVDNFPLASKILKKDMYVDNMLTGSDSKKEAQEICRQIVGILQSACMNMRQWASNDLQILKNIQETDFDKKFCFDQNSALKTLGVYWKAKDDEFIYEVQKISLDGQITKRKVLSEIAKLFDPIGLLGPIILFAKKLMQEIWKQKIEWDETLPQTLHYSWTSFCSQLNTIGNIRYKRYMCIRNAKTVELHGFCDASQSGYGTCFYLRSKDSQNQYHTSLICAKSRVAPIKTRTIPRLELCAMQLLIKLYDQIIKAIDIKIDKVYFWSDSTVALHWIKTSPHLLQVFVANRVAEIQTKTRISDWHHVRSEDNPADALSRGQLPNDFVQNKSWRNGPFWFKLDNHKWPKSNIPSLDDMPEKRKATCMLITPTIKHFIHIFQRHSSFIKLIRIITTCFRFIKKFKRYNKLRNNNFNSTAHLSNKAEIVIIKVVQNSAFSEEINTLMHSPESQDKQLSGKSKLTPLDPFLDENGLLRVGGRLQKAIQSFAQRHPIILPRNNHVTDLIIRHYHMVNHHAGVQTTLYLMREKFWVIDGRIQIKRVIHKCITCFHAKPKLISYKMGNLPSQRVRQARPFINVGVDYCGPFFIKEKKYRNQRFIKTYVAIFVCMATKAIHIEAAEDLSTEAFMAVFTRFIARRGLSENINSDNGKNFEGTNNELNELYLMLNSSETNEKIKHFSTKNRINWHFIPPKAPNFGGLWEAMVGRFKYHFKRVAYDKKFTFCEFITFCTEVEAILNSRPLTPMSTDINDLSVLTPGHFLIGDSIRSMPEENYSLLPTNRLNAWQNLKKIKQDLWSKWHKEYLSHLNFRQNKSSSSPKLKIGQLVLLQEDDVPCMEWPRARIHNVHPGDDGVIRTVTIKTSTGLLKRPSSKIAVLPIDEDCLRPLHLYISLYTYFYLLLLFIYLYKTLS